MAQHTEELKLTLPLGSCYWNYDTWNENMKILDKAFLDLNEIIIGNLTASQLTCHNDSFEATTVQEFGEEAPHKLSKKYEMTITEDTTIPIAVYAHIYLVLHFGNTVPNVTFVKSLPSAPGNFEWLNRQPVFRANKTYELSFLRLSCIWAERD